MRIDNEWFSTYGVVAVRIERSIGTSIEVNIWYESTSMKLLLDQGAKSKIVDVFDDNDFYKITGADDDDFYMVDLTKIRNMKWHEFSGVIQIIVDKNCSLQISPEGNSLECYETLIAETERKQNGT